ncbi:LOW QUALITY PROTEIN: hypothetical protein PHMEG_00038625 [Phytophthora megakarya]|uniref:Uncharacterized protein n=1 Tax=Phytophthora megakarya TaxID=4795 RepID=A0A225UIH5_9STRA|nr:LOW QUALITY PROTEIN: hypothetical protein PHMEG_00038625 [Phytophthora megakarya]
MDEATKIVTFMKDGPVKTYLFREYPSTLEDTITLAMQEGFSLIQAKLHANVPLPPRPVVKAEGPEPMELSRKGEPTYDASGAETWVTKHVSVRHQDTQAKVDVTILGISNKKRKGSVGKGCPTGNAVTRVYNGHAVLRTAAPSERESLTRSDLEFLMETEICMELGIR